MIDISTSVSIISVYLSFVSVAGNRCVLKFCRSKQKSHLFDSHSNAIVLSQFNAFCDFLNLRFAFECWRVITCLINWIRPFDGTFEGEGLGVRVKEIHLNVRADLSQLKRVEVVDHWVPLNFSFSFRSNTRLSTIHVRLNKNCKLHRNHISAINFGSKHFPTQHFFRILRWRRPQNKAALQGVKCVNEWIPGTVWRCESKINVCSRNEGTLLASPCDSTSDKQLEPRGRSLASVIFFSFSFSVWIRMRTFGCRSDNTATIPTN